MVGQVAGKFLEKAGGSLEGLAIGGVQTKFGVGEVEFILTTGDRDIEEPPFLFERRLGIEGTGAGEHPLRKPATKTACHSSPFA